jgi:cytochrome c oxidase subunit I
MTPPNVQHDYLNNDYSVRSWLLTRDHKRIGILYLLGVTVFFFLGSIPAILFRLELLTPLGDLVQAETYNKLFTMHGTVMVFFFLIPVIPGVLGNFVLPLMIGAEDLAFPRWNLASWYLFMLGGLVSTGALIAGGVDTGWTFYAPYSTSFSNTYVSTMIIGVFLSGFSSILTGMNFIVTVHKLRAPGLRCMRMPLFVWALYATSLIFVLGTPVIAITLSLVALERLWPIGIFDSALGGDPLLFQHLFWFYSHPAVYIMVLPAMGVVSELVAAFSRRRPFGYSFIAGSSLAIAFLGFLVWGHHMFVSGQSVLGGLVFSVLSFLVAIPSAVKVFNWTATLHKAQIRLDTPMLYALGFIGLFTIGGLTGLVIATLALDVHLHDTYFIIAHFHYIMVGGTLMAYLGGLHYWWPKMTGRLYPEGLSKVSAWIIFLGFNLTFFPQFVLGYVGMPRRYFAYPDEFQVLNVLHRRGHDPGRGLPPAPRLPVVVACLRPGGGHEPMERERLGVDHAFAASGPQLLRDPRGAGRGLRLCRLGPRRKPPRSAWRRRSSACGSFWRPRSCFSEGCSPVMRCSASSTRSPSRRPARGSTCSSAR